MGTEIVSIVYYVIFLTFTSVSHVPYASNGNTFFGLAVPISQSVSQSVSLSVCLSLPQDIKNRTPVNIL
jgi:hypothetical protein